VASQAPDLAPHVAALSTSELIRQTLEETKELARLEIKLAREEVRDDLLQLQRFAILAGVTCVLAVVTLTVLVVAVIFALGGTALGAFAVSGVLIVLCGVAALVAYRHLPKVPLQRTQARLKADIQQFKEHAA
jgi:uncharacterized membrane protein YqjE